MIVFWKMKKISNEKSSNGPKCNEILLKFIRNKTIFLNNCKRFSIAVNYGNKKRHISSHLFFLSEQPSLLLLELINFSLFGISGNVQRKRDSFLVLRTVRLKILVFTVFPSGISSRPARGRRCSITVWIFSDCL